VANGPPVAPIPRCCAKSLAVPKDPEELVVKSLAALDRGEPAKALALADEAVALDAEHPTAHRCRGAALAALRRADEAEEAFDAALDLDDGDPEIYLEFADFLLSARGDDPASIEEALSLARAGRDLAEEEDDAELAAELLLVEAMGLNAQGESEGALEALAQAEPALGARPDVLAERGAALYELCRFDEARAVLQDAVDRMPDHAGAHHLLALVQERQGNADEAARHFAAARRLAPDDFPEPIALSPADFDAALREAVERLPDEIRRHITGTLISVKDLPDELDLREHPDDPPLSPGILGLFRGPSLRDHAGLGELPPQIFLFQRNLERASRSVEELIEEIRVTVLHEVGHLLGLSEEDLLERGLD
jgi:predicted Zn-dependent protease with MMP-like domain/Flp pilus assembly protein TadD